MNVQPDRRTVYTAYLVKAEFEEAKFITGSNNLRICSSRRSSRMLRDVLSSHGPMTLATEITPAHSSCPEPSLTTHLT